MLKARFYAREDGRVRCLLCPRRCLIEEGGAGSCGVRRVEGGELYTANYGLCAALSWDPIEKKPLYHFYPGREILSLGTYGCNLHCTFCQNWSLARGRPGPQETRIEPGHLLGLLQRAGGPQFALGAAYTYNEPTVWYEFVYDCARLLHEQGYRNVLVTNGYIGVEALEELLPYIDALNIDLKGFSERFYNRYCRGKRAPVLATVERAARSCHVEITCLLIPDANDDPEEIEALSSWLSGISPDLPLHFSRYFPSYRLALPPTPLETLEKAYKIASKRLRYVYLGNAQAAAGADTFCPYCRKLLIERRGYHARVTGISDGRCRFCREKVNIVI